MVTHFNVDRKKTPRDIPSSCIVVVVVVKFVNAHYAIYADEKYGQLKCFQPYILRVIISNESHIFTSFVASFEMAVQFTMRFKVILSIIIIRTKKSLSFNKVNRFMRL